MPTVQERIRAHQRAGNVPAALAQARSASERASAFLAMYNEGKSAPTGVHGEFARQVDALYNQTGEIEALGSALQLCADLVATMDADHSWVREI